MERNLLLFCGDELLKNKSGSFFPEKQIIKKKYNNNKQKVDSVGHEKYKKKCHKWIVDLI